MGGHDAPYNIMELTEREHIIAHAILYKIYGYKQDLWACHVLERRKNSGYIDGENNPMSDPDIKQKHLLAVRNAQTPELREYRRKRMTENNHMKRPEQRERQRQAMLGKVQDKTRITCGCGRVMNKGPYSQHAAVCPDAI